MSLLSLPLNDDSVHAVCRAVAGFNPECTHVHARVADIAVYEMRAHIKGALERQAACLGGAFVCSACKGLQLDTQSVIRIQAVSKIVERGLRGSRQVSRVW